LVLSSEHFLAITIPNENAIEINKMLDNSAKDVAMARWNNGVERVVIISRCHIINCLLSTILKLRKMMLYLLLLRFSNKVHNLKCISKHTNMICTNWFIHQ
jgi:hypothetical protein